MATLFPVSLVSEYCSNQFFEDLPTGYAAKTLYGYYISPGDPDLVDAGNLMELGQVSVATY